MNPFKLDALHIVTLLSLQGIGRRTVQQLLTNGLTFTPSRPQELRDLLLELKAKNPKVPVPTNSELEKAHSNAENTLERAERLGIKVMTSYSPIFPKQLLNIPDPPVILYAMGNVECLSAEAMVAIIGTREPSLFGKLFAEKLALTLSNKRLIIVSGLAIGCDAAAHEGCIKAKGKTVAVLAHGLDKVYPAQNRGLAENILEFNGCLVSEYAPGTKPRSSFFVERDRLQSGLSSAVIIIETDIQGGTMHTARFCMEQKRLLGCIKHPSKFASHPKARGNQMLIAQEKAFALYEKEEIENFLQLFYKPQFTNTVNACSNGVKEFLKEDSQGQLSFFPAWD